ncbi:MAG: hypothetical protein MUO23_08270 [Anaerolineales bacterium]|nr:hypothetical protein [Anaerolineales bacterium]
MSQPRPVLDWLLEKRDPGVRFFALRDLLGAPADDPNLLAARRKTVRSSPVKEILQAMQPQGWWVKPGPGYSPKYTGTVWQIIFLGQLGADGENGRVRKAVDYVLDHSRAPEPYGGFACNATPASLIHCLQGNLCASLLELGFAEDPRLGEALDWLARSITGERIAAADQRHAAPRHFRSGNSAPGFCCAANDHLPCAWGAIPALDALSRIPVRRRTPAVRRALAEGVGFLLSRDPAAADYPMGYAAKPSQSWFRFGYPMGYVTDCLRTAEVLVRLGRGRDQCLQPLAALILSKRLADGTWPLEYSYIGKTWFDLGAKRQSNKWITLRALRALKGMGVTV